MMKNRVYISGKITGLSRDDYRMLFAHAEALLISAGYRTVNPTRFLISRNRFLYWLLGYRLVLLIDLWVLDKFCGMIYMIPGWTASVGARIEEAFACNRGIGEIMYFDKAIIDKKMMAYMVAAGMSNSYNSNNNGRTEESQEA